MRLPLRLPPLLASQALSASQSLLSTCRSQQLHHQLFSTTTTAASAAAAPLLLQPHIPPSQEIGLPPACPQQQVKSAAFLHSAYTPEQLEAFLNTSSSSRRPLVCVLGRSNVGKSALVNWLCQGATTGGGGSSSTARAKVSATPGRTASINTYLINGSWCLADCPGYGYAATTSKAHRAEWHAMTRALLKHSSRVSGTLADVLLLVDASLPPKEIDVAGVEWLLARHYPLTLVHTKCDKKPKRGQPGPADNIAAFRAQLEGVAGALLQPAQFPTCAVGSSQFGRQELLQWLARRIAAHTAAQQAAAGVAAAAS